MTDAPKTIAEMPALKPCPFCGRRPIFGLTKKTGCQLHGEPVQHVTLRCGGTGCPARAGVVGGDVYNVGKDKARDEAVAVWNRRTLPADDAEMVERVADDPMFFRNLRAYCDAKERGDESALPDLRRLVARAALSAMRGEP